MKTSFEHRHIFSSPINIMEEMLKSTDDVVCYHVPKRLDRYLKLHIAHIDLLY